MLVEFIRFLNLVTIVQEFGAFPTFGTWKCAGIMKKKFKWTLNVALSKLSPSMLCSSQD